MTAAAPFSLGGGTAFDDEPHPQNQRQEQRHDKQHVDGKVSFEFLKPDCGQNRLFQPEAVSLGNTKGQPSATDAEYQNRPKRNMVCAFKDAQDGSLLAVEFFVCPLK